jgi:hypothetical protein
VLLSVRDLLSETVAEKERKKYVARTTPKVHCETLTWQHGVEVHHLAVGTVDVVSTIVSLLAHSLLQQTNQEGEVPRLRMLVPIREYGWERLVEKQEAQECQRMHARYYLALAEEAAQHLREGGQQIRWLGRLAAEQENLRAVLTFLINRGNPSTAQSAQVVGLHRPG